MLQVQLRTAAAAAKAIERMPDGRRTDIHARCPSEVLGHELHRPARERIAQITRVLFDGLARGRLEVRVGFGRPAGALVRPQGRQTVGVELLQPALDGPAVAFDNRADLSCDQSLRSEVNRLGTQEHGMSGPSLPEAADHGWLRPPQPTDKEGL